MELHTRQFSNNGSFLVFLGSLAPLIALRPKLQFILFGSEVDAFFILTLYLYSRHNQNDRTIIFNRLLFTISKTITTFQPERAFIRFILPSIPISVYMHLNVNIVSIQVHVSQQGEHSYLLDLDFECSVSSFSNYETDIPTYLSNVVSLLCRDGKLRRR